MNPARCLAAWWARHQHPNRLDVPTPVPWRPTAPKPTLGAAIVRLLDEGK